MVSTSEIQTTAHVRVTAMESERIQREPALRGAPTFDKKRTTRRREQHELLEAYNPPHSLIFRIPDAPWTILPLTTTPHPTPVPRVSMTMSLTPAFLAAPTHNSAAMAESASLARIALVPLVESEIILARGTMFHSVCVRESKGSRVRHRGAGGRDGCVTDNIHARACIVCFAYRVHALTGEVGSGHDAAVLDTAGGADAVW